MDILYLKSRIIGSPIEILARRIISVFKSARFNPEVAEVILEDQRLPEVLRRLLTKSSNVVDVGCHIGGFLTLAGRFAPEGRHVAIEASPTKARWLRSRFPQYRIEAIAISDQMGTAQFHENTHLPGYSKLTNDARLETYSVKTTTLDALELQSVRLLKLDIEGAELLALKGAPNLLARERPVIIFECGAEANEGLDRKGLFDLLVSADYLLFTFADFLYSKGPLSFDEFRKCGIYPFRAFNFIALPK